MKLPLAVLLALAVIGCGGGGSAEPTKQAAASCEPIRVQLFGDSTMAGFDGATFITTQSPAIHLQEAMDAKFGKGAVTVESRGASNTTSAQLIAGTDGVNPPWPHGVHADIIVVNHGINDAQVATGIDQYRTNLRTFAAGPWRTLFMTPTPNWDRAILPDDYAQAMRDEAAALAAPVADAHAYMMQMPGWRNLVPDGIHPTADGYYRIVRDVLAPAVEPLVVSMRCR
jgi:lysophospholipase L1-like esterase